MSAHDGVPPGPAAAAVILAGGAGSRLGSDVNKVYLPIAGHSVLAWSFSWSRQLPEIGRFVLVVRPQDQHLAEEMLDREVHGLTVDIVIGGPSRHESEHNALLHLEPDILGKAIDVVVIHDGARPLAAPSLWRSVLATARVTGGAVPAVPASGLIRLDQDRVHRGGTSLVRVQTPQAFLARPLLAAYRAADAAQHTGSDTASSVERFSDLPIQCVPGSVCNVKVTFRQDLLVAGRLLARHRYRLH